MRGMVALILLLVAGCGAKPVDEDEFRSWIGKPVADVQARLGPADEHVLSDRSMLWKGKVVGRDGKKRKWAGLNYNFDNMLVIEASVSHD
jgi:hypothetical protein